MRIHCDVMSRSRVRDITLMLGLRRRKTNDGGSDQNGDVARLFFDSFSKRVGIVEDGLKNMSTEVNKLKISMDRSQLSDLVLSSDFRRQRCWLESLSIGQRRQRKLGSR